MCAALERAFVYPPPTISPRKLHILGPKINTFPTNKAPCCRKRNHSVLDSALPFISLLTWGKLLKLSDTQSPSLKNGCDNTYFTGLWQGLNEKANVKTPSRLKQKPDVQ